MNRRYIDFVPTKKDAAAKLVVDIGTVEEPAVVESNVAVAESVARPVVAKPPVVKPAVRPVASPAVRPAAKPVAQSVVKPAASKAQYGVIEDYKPKFVQTEVKKRPLSGAVRSGVTQPNVGVVTKPRQNTGMARPGVKSAGAGSSGRIVRKAPQITQEAHDELLEAKQQRIAEQNKLLETALAKAEEISRTKKETREAKKEARKEAKLAKVPRVPFVNTDKIVKRPLSKNVYKKKVEVPREEPKGPVTIIEKPERDSRIGMIVAIILTIILGAAAGTVAFLLLPK